MCDADLRCRVLIHKIVPSRVYTVAPLSSMLHTQHLSRTTRLAYAHTARRFSSAIGASLSLALSLSRAPHTGARHGHVHLPGLSRYLRRTYRDFMACLARTQPSRSPTDCGGERHVRARGRGVKSTSNGASKRRSSSTRRGAAVALAAKAPAPLQPRPPGAPRACRPAVASRRCGRGHRPSRRSLCSPRAA